MTVSPSMQPPSSTAPSSPSAAHPSGEHTPGEHTTGEHARSEQLRPVVVRHLVAEFDRRGADTAPLFAGLGLCADDLCDPDCRLPPAHTREILRRALQQLPEENLGVNLGQRVNLVSWGHCLLGMMACRDSQQLLDFASRTLPSTAGLVSLRLEVRPQGPRLSAQALVDDPAVGAFLIDKIFAGLTRACRSIVDLSYRPIGVELARRRPVDPQPYAQAFPCRVQFEQAANTLQFPPEVVPIASADAVVLRQVQGLLDLTPDPMQGAADGLEQRIVAALRGELSHPPSAVQLAARLFVSERTLRRRLAQRGLSFGDVLDRERCKLALELIRADRQNLHEIAAQVGYADPRGLRRAVKRWTGLTPAALRDKSAG